MKKLIIGIIVLCAIYAGVVGYTQYKNKPDVSEPYSAAAEAADTASAAGHLDFKAIYESREPDEIVMTINGNDVTWQEYFYWFYSQASQLQEYFDVMSIYYGSDIKWDDVYEDGGEKTYAQMTAEAAEANLEEIYSIEGLAEENGVALSDDDKAAINEQLQNDIVALCGEGATEEDFFSALADRYETRDLYEQSSRIAYLYQNTFTELYGKNGEKVSEEDAVAYFEENGYIYANHILLANTDRETGEVYSDEIVAEKKAKAESIVEELRAIEDKDELVRRFGELKEELCDDPGKVQFPNGYVFTSGDMVAEFEEASKALEEYGVSDVIETAYGYHVIIRLPLSADMVVDYASSGAEITGRGYYANISCSRDWQEYRNNMPVEYKETFKDFDVTDYIIK